jgi:DNA-binding PadR family transcriptional regulator
MVLSIVLKDTYKRYIVSLDNPVIKRDVDMFGRRHMHDFFNYSRLFAMAGRGRGGERGGWHHHGRHGGRDDRGFPFGRGGGRGRFFGPGDLRLVLLASIEEKPRHGYELIKELEQKFGGAYAPSPGSVYPTLTLLEELGHVRASTSEGTKRLFEITADGTNYLRENDAALKSALSRMDMAARAVSDDAPPPDLHHAMHTLKAALMFHRGGWDDEEIERVRKIIEDAADAISRKR